MYFFIANYSQNVTMKFDLQYRKKKHYSTKNVEEIYKTYIQI